MRDGVLIPDRKENVMVAARQDGGARDNEGFVRLGFHLARENRNRAHKLSPVRQRDIDIDQPRVSDRPAA